MSEGYRGGATSDVWSIRFQTMEAALPAPAFVVMKIRPARVPAQTTFRSDGAGVFIERRPPERSSPQGDGAAVGEPAEVARVAHRLPVVAHVDRRLVRAVLVDVAVADPEVAVLLHGRVREGGIDAAIQRAEDVLTAGEHQLADPRVEERRGAERHELAVVAERCCPRGQK